MSTANSNFYLDFDLEKVSGDSSGGSSDLPALILDNNSIYEFNVDNYSMTPFTLQDLVQLLETRMDIFNLSILDKKTSTVYRFSNAGDSFIFTCHTLKFEDSDQPFKEVTEYIVWTFLYGKEVIFNGTAEEINEQIEEFVKNNADGGDAQ